MFKFTPKLNEETKIIIENKEQINRIANCYGSPCNILFPSVMDNNVNEFNEVFKKFNLIRENIFCT